MSHRVLLTCFLLAALVACAQPPAAPPSPAGTLALSTNTLVESPTFTPGVGTPTELPVSSLPSLTAEPLPTDTPAPPLPTLSNPTVTVTIFPQPAAQTGAIQFFKPGPMSRVTSPVTFYGYAVPGHDHKGLIELVGEDGSLLNSEIIQLNTDYKWAFFSWRLDFTPRGAGELGRLSLSTRDEYGRLTALRAMHLLLLPTGPEIINPSDTLAERFIMEAPEAGKRISGGVLALGGKMQSYNDQPLIIELISREGTSLGAQLVPIPPGQAGNYIDFHLEIPYSVRVSTSVLLTLRQPDDRIPGTMYLFSQEITLYP